MVYSKTGVTLLNTGTGPQSVTGLGFEPKLVIVSLTPSLVANISPLQELHRSFGAYDGIYQFFTNQTSQYGVVTPNTAVMASDVDGAVIVSPPGTSTVIAKIDFISLDADGFTFQVNVAPPFAYRLGYWAIGGDDIANVKIGNFLSNAGVGTQAITGLGFEPDILLFSSSRLATAFGNGSTAFWNIGIAGGSPITQYGIANYSRDGIGLPTTRKMMTATYPLSHITTTYNILGDVQSLDSDGFTLNWIVALARYFYYIAIETTADFKIGSVLLNNSIGTQAVTGVGFTPSTGMFMSHCSNNLTTTPSGDNEASLGFVDQNLLMQNFWHLDSITGAQTRNYNYQSDQYVYNNWDYTGTVVPIGQAKLDSWDADGFTLDITTAETIPSYLVYLLFGAGSPPIVADDSFGIIV